jgi:hypothetical protein
MASRSSPSTHSQRTSMTAPSGRSRTQQPSQGRGNAADQPRTRGPSEKKHKNMSEVRSTGRQSDQGGRPGGSRRSSGQGSR